MPPPVTQRPNDKKNSKRPSVLDRIQPIGFDADDGIKCMLYGASGTGKTTLWSSFPAPILALICSGGQKSGELRSIDTPENRKRIKTVTINETSEIKDLVEHAAPDFATLVLDHVSGLQDFTLKEILGLDELPAQKSFGMATMDNYGQSTQMCKEYLRAMLNLKGNVVIIGQERVFNITDNGEVSEILKPTVGVATTPSLAGWLNPSVDYIMQTFKRPKLVKVEKKVGDKTIVKTEKRGEEYCLRCAAGETFVTKFRKPKEVVLPEIITDPTYDKIMRIIRGQPLEDKPKITKAYKPK